MFVFTAVLLFLLALTGCNADDNPSQNSTVPAAQNQPATDSQADPTPPIGNTPPANLAAEPEDMFTHIFDTELNGLRITRYHGELTQVLLPDEIMGFPIVAIDSGSFDVRYVTDVFFPDTVQYFGWGGRVSIAADEERPTSWVIPHGVTHLYQVYAIRGGSRISVGSDVRHVDMPPTVKYIGDGVFQNFRSLTSLTIPYGVTTIGSIAFQDMPALLSIDFPASIISISINSGIQDTSWWATQPDGVVYVGSVAYRWKGEIPPNTTVVIRDGTVTLGNRLFTPVIGGGPAIGSPAPGEPVSPPATDTQPTTPTNLISVTLPDSLINIGVSAFSGTTLENITLPNSVERIDGGAFGDTLISSITLPLNIVYTPNNHMWGSNINTLYIQAGVDSVYLGFGVSQQLFHRSSGEYWGNIALVWLD